MTSINWRILLIGGNSGAGKTFLAQNLVRKLSVPYMMVDDIRIALQKATTPEFQPDLHVFLKYQPEQWLKPESIVQDWIRVGNGLITPLREIMAHHLVVEGSGPLIIEGDGILPILTLPEPFQALTGFDEIDIPNLVRAVFLIENNEKEILKNLQTRDRGISSAAIENQIAFAKASKLYADWLKQAAHTYQLPVISTRPKETVLGRVLEIISQPL